MISTTGRWVFIHVPKTAGSSLSRVLVPFSDDHLEPELGTRAGLVDTFEVRGPLTRDKHATLRQYAAGVGPALDDYRVLTSVRHPVDRMVSLYLHSSMWLRPRIPGARTLARRIPRFDSTALLRRDEQVWSRARFEELVRRWPPQTDYLRDVHGRVVDPAWTFDPQAPQRSLQDLGRLLNLPLGTLPSSNGTTAPALAADLREDPFVHRVVRWLHAADFDHFGYR